MSDTLEPDQTAELASPEQATDQTVTDSQATAVLDPKPFEQIAAPEQPAVPRPRIRSGAIVWGALISATALLVLAITTSPPNAAAFSRWSGQLGVAGVILAAVIAVGAFILIMALLSVIRRAQRKRRATPTG